MFGRGQFGVRYICLVEAMIPADRVLIRAGLDRGARGHDGIRRRQRTATTLICSFRGRRIWLLRYYGRIRLLVAGHHRLRLLAFPMRTNRGMPPWSTTRPPGSRTKSVCTCQGLRPRRVVGELAIARPFVWPSAYRTASAPGISAFSWLNGWPAHSPVK